MMIRSTAHSLKFANASKRHSIVVFLTEYRRLLQAIVDGLWKDGLPEFGLDIAYNKLGCPSFLPA